MKGRWKKKIRNTAGATIVFALVVKHGYVCQKIKEKASKKLCQKSGESLVETLASMLIIVLAVEILTGALVSAARVNRSAGKSSLFQNETEGVSVKEDDTVTVTSVSDGSGADMSEFLAETYNRDMTVKVYKNQSGDPDSDTRSLYYYK